LEHSVGPLAEGSLDLAEMIQLRRKSRGRLGDNGSSHEPAESVKVSRRPAPILRYSDITKSYRTGKTNVLALSHVSFDMSAGETVALLGPNGAGKTTLIKLLCRLLIPDIGHIHVAGKDISTEPHLLRRVGVVLEGARGLYSEFTPLENLAYILALYRYPISQRRERAIAMLKKFGLSGEIDVPTKRLSLGMRQRVLLAASMAHNPSVLVLDEPTTGLDPGFIGELKTTIRALSAAGVGVLIATHHLEVAQELCQRAIIISGGRLTFDGRVDDGRPDGEPRYRIEATNLSAEAGATLVRKYNATVSGDLVSVLCDASQVYEIIDCMRPSPILSINALKTNLRDLYDEHTGSDRPCI
jgi:ABC-2 type transport system ATP-binding protein